MKKNKIIIYIVAIFILFIIPIGTVFIKTDALRNGEEFLFKVEAFDPYDMFRGNYLRINFMEQDVVGEYPKEGEYGDWLYVSVDKSGDGFAYFSNISLEEPKNTSNYYKTRGYYSEYRKTYNINTPTRYYMNENQSLDAEEVYNENTEYTYVKVKVKDGQMVIVGVYVNDVLIDTIEPIQKNI
jgi:uncharacterized membrane-anchored protein